MLSAKEEFLDLVQEQLDLISIIGLDDPRIKIEIWENDFRQYGIKSKLRFNRFIDNLDFPNIELYDEEFDAFVNLVISYITRYYYHDVECEIRMNENDIILSLDNYSIVFVNNNDNTLDIIIYDDKYNCIDYHPDDNQITFVNKYKCNINDPVYTIVKKLNLNKNVK